ncbi:hypothetical protein HHI36_003653 [Cryptolaemus montrouzieri]|uniref:chitinase n=1 Tax=Cryptolaemus montrouzieri TaxID=559131 RepID=A0ABD2PE07_9CUCU
MIRKLVFLFVLLSASTYFADAKTERVICYYGSWASYRPGNGQFTPEDIPAGYCTHLIYTFLGIDTSGNLKILDSNLEIRLRGLERFNALKQKYPKLKTLIAVGGWNEGSAKYSVVAADSRKRATLIKSAINFLETYGFDGFDIDWEYPGQRDGSWSDKANFAILLKEFRQAFDKKGFILTAAVAAAAGSVDISYDVPALSKYLDSINVMAYDLHASYDGVTGANAPLYPSSVDRTPSAKSLTVDASIRGWIDRGADPQKISLGLPMYGKTFTLVNPNSRSVGSIVSSAGIAGPYTQESGTLGYLEICEKQKEGGWSIVWDENTKTPYTYKGNQWIGYDNEDSIRAKVEYAKSLNLGGVMIWSVETIDAKGICGKKIPLLSTIREVLNEQSGNDDDDNNEKPLPEPAPNPKPDGSDESDKDSSSNESKPSNESKEDSKESESSNESEGDDDNGRLCNRSGLVRDPKDCSVFYSCVPNGGDFIPFRFVCSNGLVFDKNVNSCNYRHLVDCGK